MPYSDEPIFDEPISIVEDLEPEPPSKKGLGRAWEVVLGVLLLLGVVMFAGWQWFHEQSQQNSYAQAQQALANRDLEGARSFFSQASGYKDSDGQAKELGERIKARDLLYTSSNQHAAKGEWAAALQDIRAVEKIEPSYKQTEEIERTALQNVYTDALSGTVALRANANPPGLYYRAADDWLWLEGSDKDSVVFSYRLGGKIVYDAPGAGWVP